MRLKVILLQLALLPILQQMHASKQKFSQILPGYIPILVGFESSSQVSVIVRGLQRYCSRGWASIQAPKNHQWRGENQSTKRF